MSVVSVSGHWGAAHRVDSVVKTECHETLFAFLNHESHETDGEERSSKMEDESCQLRRCCWIWRCCWWAEEMQEEEEEEAEDGGRRDREGELAEEVKMEEVRLRKSRSSSSLPPAEVCGPTGCFLQRATSVTWLCHLAVSHGCVTWLCHMGPPV